MTNPSETRPPEENLAQVISLIGITILLVFYSDITTPLGLMTWILYFIPLFLTLYIRWQYGPFVVAGTAIILIGISFFISPRDMSEFYALINRGFFSVLLIVSALLIWRNKKREVHLQISEERYQNMIESSPDAIVIIKGDEIRYLNPSALELGGSVSVGGTNYLDLFHPDYQPLISSTLEKGTEGAKIELSDLMVGHTNFWNHQADVWIGELYWDGQPAVQMIIRIKTR